MSKSMFRVKFIDKYCPETCGYADMLVVADDIVGAIWIARNNQEDDDAKVSAAFEEHTQLVTE